MQTKRPDDDKLDAVKIGQRIQQARIKKGITQEELGRCVNRTPKYISNLEIGINCPSVKLLITLSKALDVRVEYLLMDDPDIDPTYTLNPEMEIRSRKMTPATRITCLAMMDQLIEVQNSSFEAGRKEQANKAKK